MTQKASFSSNILYQKTVIEFNEGKLDKVLKVCQNLDDNPNDTQTEEQKKKWNDLKQKATEGIAQKREINSLYASDIILPNLPTISITERAIENNESPVRKTEDIPNKDFWQKCIVCIKSGEMNRLNNLCTKQLYILNEDENAFSDDIKSIQTWLNFVRSNYFTQAREYCKKQLGCSDKKSLQEELWSSIDRKSADLITYAERAMHTLLNPKPQKGIDWDRFAKPLSPNFHAYINRDKYSKLYDALSVGKKTVESQMKRQLIIFTCTTLLLTFAIPYALYSNGYTSDFESKIIAPFITAMSLLISLAYILITTTFAEERMITAIRKEHCLEKKEI